MREEPKRWEGEQLARLGLHRDVERRKDRLAAVRRIQIDEGGHEAPRCGLAHDVDMQRKPIPPARAITAFTPQLGKIKFPVEE